MRTLLLLVLCSMQFYNVNCEFSFNWVLWTDNIPESFLINVTISEVPYSNYNKFDNKFIYYNMNQNLNISYPSSFGNPQISFPGALIFRYINFSDVDPMKNRPNMEVLDVIKKVKLNGNVSLDFGLAIIDFSDPKIYLQYVFLWNRKETYLVVNIDKIVENPKGFSVALGRGREPFVLDKYVARQGRYIFLISSRDVINLNCNNISGSPGIILNSFSLSPSYLSNMGGERINITGPCPMNLELPKIVMSLKDAKHQFTVDAELFTNVEKNGFYFFTPLLWYPGTYVLYFKYDSVEFVTEAQVYQTDNYFLSWELNGQTNNGMFDVKSVRVITPKYKKEINFTVFKMDTSNIKRPVVIGKERTCNNDVGPNCILMIEDLNKVDFDITKDVGFFSTESSSKEIYWSPPFSLAWLKNNKNTDLDQSACRKFLSENKKQTPMLCPNHSTKMEFYQSKFQGGTFRKLFTNTLITEFNQYDCYVQMAKSDNQHKNEYNGVTCCYDTLGYLMYGQEYYLHKNQQVSSYGWTYSPIFDPYNHLFFDRLPMMRCCPTNSIDILCSQYWEMHNNVQSQDFLSDYSGNVFGDPHIIPFHGQFNYTFLSRGEYWLIKAVPKNFSLQGRFYSTEKSKSLLKAIVFGNSSDHIMISTKRNIGSMYDWSVLVNNQTVQIPFSSQGTTIVQSKDTLKLDIFIGIDGQYFVHIELTRLYNVYQFDEYLNMRIFLSNNFVGKIEGGLLGKINQYYNGSSLFPRYTPKKSTTMDEAYYEFAKTWILNDISESLFYYLPNTTEHSILNAEDTFITPTSTDDPNCDDVQFCKIDKGLYSSGTMSNETLTAYKKREEYENNFTNLSQYRSCGHPKWFYIKLNSSSFLPDSVININGCIDSKMNITENSQTIKCLNSTLTWQAIPAMKDNVCSEGTPLPVKPESGSRILVYILVPLGLLLLIITIAGMIFLYKKKQSRSPVVMKSEFSTTSQDPLGAPTSIPLDDVYDTWNPVHKEKSPDVYEVYSKIQKPKVDEN